MSNDPHPYEESGEDSSAERPVHHNWFFYVAGFFLMLALIGYVLGDIPALPSNPSPPEAPPSGESK